jgi:hypothetical protein
MKKTLQTKTKPHLPILRSGDPNSVLHRMPPAELLARFGPPRSLLSSSSKAEKCLSVNVLARVLFLTPGVFCSHASKGCLAACLGHSSGRMQMPTHAIARDRRTALYRQSPQLFLQMLDLDLSLLEQDARRSEFLPAARLNGSSDLPWEELHPNIFSRHPEIRFFDYTKVPDRMDRYLRQRNWPKNYHLTFSAQPDNHDVARRFLHRGGTVAVVFWPESPDSFWGHPVIDGDKHDARFLDAAGSIVALSAKGMAQKDSSGFTVRLCPQCQDASQVLSPEPSSLTRGRSMAFHCNRCGVTIRHRRALLDANAVADMAA